LLGTQRQRPASPGSRRALGENSSPICGSDARPGAFSAAWARRYQNRRSTGGHGTNERKEPVSTVKLVEESTNHPKVRAIFADIKTTKKIDRVPNIWRALATNPEHLELCWTRLKAI